MAQTRSHSPNVMAAAPPPQSLLWPAMTVLPFLRRPLGEYVVRPTVVIIGAGLLVFPIPAVFSFWCGFAGVPLGYWDLTWLSGFAVIYFVTALVIWYRRWRGVWESEPIHGAETGISWIAEQLPLPIALSETVVVPALVMIVGYIVWHTVSLALGLWLILCGVSLALLASWEFRRRRAWHRAFLDDTLDAQSQEDGIRYHTGEFYTKRRPVEPNPFFAAAGTAVADGARAFLKWWWRK